MFFFTPIKLAFRLVSLVITAAIVYLVVSGVQVALAARASSDVAAAGTASAIVVVGSPGTAADNSALDGRLAQAVALFEAKVAPIVVATSPVASSGAPGSIDEESAYLGSHGVPKAALREELGSTAAVLGATASLLRSSKDVVIVSDAVNVAVVTHEAASAGLVAVASPSPSSKVAVFAEVGPLVRNATALAVGRVIGYGHVGWADWS